MYAQLGQQPLARTVLRRHSIKPRLALGTLSCLSARPPDLATVTAAQTKVATVRAAEHCLVSIYSKRTAVTRSPGSRYRQTIVLWPFWPDHSWNYPLGLDESSLERWRWSAPRRARRTQPTREYSLSIYDKGWVHTSIRSAELLQSPERIQRASGEAVVFNRYFIH